MNIIIAKRIIELIAIIPIITLILSIIYGFNLWNQKVCSGPDKDHGKCATKAFQFISIVIFTNPVLWTLAGYIIKTIYLK